MENFLNRFKLYNEKEKPEVVYDLISKAVPFRGTNLWILIFAIFIASLGLNVNSTAVIIGAMLISPLMGPIVGIGYSAAINDSSLLRKSITNYLSALIVGLAASTIYFLLTPIHDAQSEILSRTQPTIYDVLIAVFGGFAGILAACSTQKGNVVPGVAIATALMPPLCTAGFGLAALNWTYLFGALYLYLINSVFIALATFLTVRYLRYPYKEFLDEKEKKKSRNIITLVTVLTIIPSIYFGYDIIKQGRFTANAEKFIANETRLKDNVILDTDIDPKKEIIELSVIGKPITDSMMDALRDRLDLYHIPNAELKVKQGLSFLNEEDEIVDNNIIEIEKDRLQSLQHTLDSLQNESELSQKLYRELKAEHPTLKSAYIQKANRMTDSTYENDLYLAYLYFDNRIPASEKERINKFLEARLEGAKFELITQ